MELRVVCMNVFLFSACFVHACLGPKDQALAQNVWRIRLLHKHPTAIRASDYYRSIRLLYKRRRGGEKGAEKKIFFVRRRRQPRSTRFPYTTLFRSYQAKEIFRKYNVRVPEGQPAFSVAEALSAYDTLGSETVVVKAQIHAGGRGKGGGIKLAHSRNDVEALATQMLGMNLVTHQTGPEGKEVQRLLIETGIDIAQEFYAGIVLDRKESKFVFMEIGRAHV